MSRECVIWSVYINTVNHNILEQYGICGNELKWFRSYLTDRKQYVSFNEQSSELMEINCSVPQGSVLGLFDIY